jgi:hypothetical protein
MISREYMERYYPEFVAKLDEELKQATKFNKSQKHHMLKEKRVIPQRNFTTSPHGYLQEKIRELLAETYEPMRLWEITIKSGGVSTSVYKAIETMFRRGELVRPERGFYQLVQKEGP